MDKFKKLEYWLAKEGIVIERDQNGIWGAYTAYGEIEIIAEGTSLENLVDNLPQNEYKNTEAENKKEFKEVEFKDVPLNCKFSYLEEEWQKTSPRWALRSYDGYKFFFNGETLVNFNEDL